MVKDEPKSAGPAGMLRVQGPYEMLRKCHEKDEII
jgi:hypothetical protein